MLIHKPSFWAFAAVLVLAGSAQAEKPLVHTKFDANAKQVELFSAMQEDLISVKLVAKDSSGGVLLISNKTQEPLTVKAPEGFVAVPANAQFSGGAQFGGGQFGSGFSGSNQGGGGGQAGGSRRGQLPQPIGGGLGSGPSGSGLSGIGNPGFFSIPAEKTLRVPFNSVCLAYGQPEPGPQSKYNIVKIEEYTNSSALQSVIKMVGNGNANQRAVQAATWNITDGMTWQQLGALHNDFFASPDAMMFSRQDLGMAQTIIVTTQKIAANQAPRNENSTTQPGSSNTPVRTLQTK